MMNELPTSSVAPHDNVKSREDWIKRKNQRGMIPRMVESVGYMMQCVVLDGNLIDESGRSGNWIGGWFNHSWYRSSPIFSPNSVFSRFEIVMGCSGRW